MTKLTYSGLGELIVFAVVSPINGNWQRTPGLIFPTRRKALNYINRNKLNAYVTPVRVFPGQMEAERLARAVARLAPGASFQNGDRQ